MLLYSAVNGLLRLLKVASTVQAESIVLRIMTIYMVSDGVLLSMPSELGLLSDHRMVQSMQFTEFTKLDGA